VLGQAATLEDGGNVAAFDASDRARTISSLVVPRYRSIRFGEAAAVAAL
jgi:hypothetical protein